MVSHVSAIMAMACQRIAAGVVKGMVSNKRVPNHVQKFEKIKRKSSAISFPLKPFQPRRWLLLCQCKDGRWLRAFTQALYVMGNSESPSIGNSENPSLFGNTPLPGFFGDIEAPSLGNMGDPGVDGQIPDPGFSCGNSEPGGITGDPPNGGFDGDMGTPSLRAGDPESRRIYRRRRNPV